MMTKEEIADQMQETFKGLESITKDGKLATSMVDAASQLYLIMVLVDIRDTLVQINETLMVRS